MKTVLGRTLASPTVARAWSMLVNAARTMLGLPVTPARERAIRILIVKLDRIGDMVLTSPLLRELRRAFPEAWITLIAAESVRPLLASCPHISEAFFIEPAADSLRAKLRRWRDNTRLAWKELLARRYTHALLPRYGVDHYLSYHLLALSGAHERIGFSVDVDPVKATENRGCDRLLTQVLPRVPSGHEVERILRVLAPFDCQPVSSKLELWLDPAAREHAAHLAARWSGCQLIGVCPSAHELVRDWPFSSFVETFARFAASPKVQFVIFGGPGLEWIGDALGQNNFTHVTNLAGQFSLDVVAALIAHCKLFVTVDTGLMHLAAAQGIPIVEISSQPSGGDPNHHHSPERFGPWQVPHRILRPPTGALPRPNERLIQQVSVDEVVAAMRALLSSLA